MESINENFGITLAKHVFDKLKKILFSSELSDYSRRQIASDILNEVDAFLQLDKTYFNDSYWSRDKFLEIQNLIEKDRFADAHQLLKKGPVNILH